VFVQLWKDAGLKGIGTVNEVLAQLESCTVLGAKSQVRLPTNPETHICRCMQLRTT
jgi:hypothetical protein